MVGNHEGAKKRGGGEKWKGWVKKKASRKNIEELIEKGNLKGLLEKTGGGEKRR